MVRNPSFSPSQLSQLGNIRVAPREHKSQPKPWDRRIATAGDAARESIFTAIGRATVNWGFFEGGVARVFSRLLGANQTDVLQPMVAYGAVRTFEGRLEMVRAVATRYFMRMRMDDVPKELQERAAKLEAPLRTHTTKEWREFAARRNDIIHGILSVHLFGAAGESEPLWVLVPEYYDEKKTREVNIVEFIYSSSEINYYAEQFWKIMGQAHSIQNELTDIWSSFR